MDPPVTPKGLLVEFTGSTQDDLQSAPRPAVSRALEQSVPARHAVHKTENCGVGPDPDRQRQERHCGKPRTLPKRPHSVTQVLKQRDHCVLDDRPLEKFVTLPIRESDMRDAVK